jgi:UDPglucose 6-dehydrogenase
MGLALLLDYRIKMKVGFVGLGKLGMPCALAMDMKGHDVMGFDVDSSKMQKTKFPHREKGPNGEKSIEPLLGKSGLKFGSLSDIVKHSEIIFVAVQTPHDERYEGTTRIPKKRIDFDYRYLVQSLKNLSKEIDKNGKNKVVVVISTVLPGTMRKHVIPHLSKRVKLCYNPYFIAMGTTMNDFYHPEFVLFGVADEWAAKVAEKFYKSIHSSPFYKTSIENAELIKVAYNTFIGMKIVFANTLMEICHKIPGTNVDEVVKALHLAKDRLISPKYLAGGMGDGGGCHPRDNIALSWLARELGLSYDWFESVMVARERQTEWLAELMASYKMPKYIFGKAFKEGTNLTVGSPSILLKNILEEKKIKVTMYDPYIDAEKPKLTKGLYFIGTKHPDFKSYKFPKGSVIIDPWRYIGEQKGVKLVQVGVGV